MKVSCETRCLLPRGEFEQPPVQDSPLWPYPERGERGCKSTRSTLGLRQGTGRPGALLPHRSHRCLQGEGAGQHPAMLLSLFPGCWCGVRGRNWPVQEGRGLCPGYPGCGDLFGGMLLRAWPSLPSRGAFFGVLQLPGRWSFPSSSLWVWCLFGFCWPFCLKIIPDVFVWSDRPTQSRGDEVRARRVAQCASAPLLCHGAAAGLAGLPSLSVRHAAACAGDLTRLSL